MSDGIRKSELLKVITQQVEFSTPKIIEIFSSTDSHINSHTKPIESASIFSLKIKGLPKHEFINSGLEPNNQSISGYSLTHTFKKTVGEESVYGIPIKDYSIYNTVNSSFMLPSITNCEMLTPKYLENSNMFNNLNIRTKDELNIFANFLCNQEVKLRVLYSITHTHRFILKQSKAFITTTNSNEFGFFSKKDAKLLDEISNDRIWDNLLQSDRDILKNILTSSEMLVRIVDYHE